MLCPSGHGAHFFGYLCFGYLCFGYFWLEEVVAPRRGPES